MAEIDTQTEEALGWAAEGDKLAVDIPEVSLKEVGTFVASMTPIIGDAMAAKDVYDELQKDEPNYYLAGALGGAAIIGLIPGVGDIAAKAIRKGAKEVFDVAKRVEVDPNAMGSGLGNLRLKPKQDDVAEAAAILDSNEALSAWQQSNKIPENKRQANTQKAQAAAEDLYQGSITSKEARQIINEDLPITSLYTAESMPNMPTVTEVAGSLGKKVQKTGVVGVKGFDIPAGTRVGSRLDIPAYNNYDKWVVSIHDGKNDTKGSVLGYGQAVRLKNIKFGSESKEALNIARGKRTTTKGEEKPMPKATIARVYGDYVPEDPYALQELARTLLSDPEWTQVGMNPYRQSNFYDKNTGLPVFEADEVIQVGPLVLAKGVKKPTKSQLKALAVRTKDGKLRLFNEGGAVMDEQMEMAFSEGDRVDPVSGNEVPLGSTPKEVRDDIPAQLSEGEYVVPADVVRFFGVKLFEDLRMQAKMGFQQMEANGRIGGEPVEGMEVIEPEDDLDITFDDSDFEVVDGYAEGGVVDSSAALGVLSASGFQGNTGMETREYVNSTGNIINILFFNGMPMSAIPQGYTYVEPKPDPVSTGGSVTTAADVRDDDSDTIMDTSAPEALNYKELSSSELQAMVEDQKSVTGDAIGLGAAVINPFFGVAVKAAMWHQRKQVEKEITRRMNDETLGESERGQYADLLEISMEDSPGMWTRLFGTEEEKDSKGIGKLPFDPISAEPEAITNALEEAIEYTGQEPVPDPEPIEVTSLNDEPGARDYKGPLADFGTEATATLSPRLDSKGELPDPYVFNPETPAVSSSGSNFLASEDDVIAEQRREEIAKRVAKQKAKSQRKIDAVEAKISAREAIDRDRSDDDLRDTMKRAREAYNRNKDSKRGAQTKKGSTAGSKSGYFD